VCDSEAMLVSFPMPTPEAGARFAADEKYRTLRP
jgi:hypothetical protein